MDITIKTMETAEEIEGKSRVHWQTWREAYDEILPAEFQEQMTLDKCRFYSQKYPENTLIALDNAKVVGFVSYGDFQDSATIAGEIFALYVLLEIIDIFVRSTICVMHFYFAASMPAGKTRSSWLI